MGNKQYWENFYEREQPTEFAKFCVKYMHHKANILELGCGNGRDSNFFGDIGHSVIGIDYAFRPQDTFTAIFFKTELKELLKQNRDYDILYSRFFLHSITNQEIINLVKWAKGMFMAEFRIKGDKPILFKDHKRNMLEYGWLDKLLIKNNFKIMYSDKSRGWAKYKNEDPLVARVIAAKNVSI